MGSATVGLVCGRIAVLRRLYFAIFRLTLVEQRKWPALAFLLAMMAANVLWNILFFRLKRLRLVHWFNIGYAAWAAVTVWFVFSADTLASSLLWVYAAHLPYAIALGRAWLSLNPEQA